MLVALLILPYREGCNVSKLRGTAKTLIPTLALGNRGLTWNNMRDTCPIRSHTSKPPRKGVGMTFGSTTIQIHAFYNIVCARYSLAPL